jgi:hypothetical protein
LMNKDDKTKKSRCMTRAPAGAFLLQGNALCLQESAKLKSPYTVAGIVYYFLQNA